MPCDNRMYRKLRFMCRVPLIMKDMKKRILAGLIACITVYSFSGNQAVFLSSAEEKPTVQELENQKAENDKKIAELKKEIIDTLPLCSCRLRR